MISTRPHAGYLHTELTGLGFADLGIDPEEMGGYDALFTRVYQGYGLQIEVHEQYGDVTLRVFGPGEAAEGENTYRNGHLTETKFTVEMPSAIVMAAISAAVKLGQDTDRLYAVPAAV